MEACSKGIMGQCGIKKADLNMQSSYIPVKGWRCLSILLWSFSRPGSTHSLSTWEYIKIKIKLPVFRDPTGSCNCPCQVAPPGVILCSTSVPEWMLSAGAGSSFLLSVSWPLPPALFCQLPFLALYANRKTWPWGGVYSGRGGGRGRTKESRIDFCPSNTPILCWYCSTFIYCACSVIHKAMTRTSCTQNQ